MANWTLGGTQYSRDDLCAILRGEIKCGTRGWMGAAAIMLEKDKMIMDDLRLTIYGLKAKNNRIQEQLNSTKR